MKDTQISIGIIAYNEENNLQETLAAQLTQNHRGINIVEIIVISDGSTDQTVTIAHNFARQSSLVKVINENPRKGKVARLNQLFKIFKGDILVVFDADILIPPDTVFKLVTPIIKKQAVLTAAHQVPLKSPTLIGRTIYAGYRFWDIARLSVPHQVHIQNFYGAASAYHRQLALNLSIPSDIGDERGYIYLSAKKFGKFAYIFDAPIYYWPVETLSDFLKLFDRSFAKNQQILEKYFGKNVHQEYLVPFRFKIKAVVLSLFYDPIFTLGGIVLNIFTRIYRQPDRLYQHKMWDISLSTKKKFNRTIPYE